MFKKRENVVEIEEGNLLSPKFDNDGLIPVITMCAKTKEILMHGYMNVEALKKTIETKEAHYFSRSRNTIWHKGKTSGFTQKVNEIRIDDDQDSIWLTVDIGDGASCHVGYRSCFYRSIPLGPIENGRKVEMEFLEWCKAEGNDLITPHPEFGFPGLKDGDGWCVCATWYARAVEAGKGCPIYLKSTHENTLKILPIETLKKFAIDLS